MERGGGVNSSEDARHCSVLYICKYFVVLRVRTLRYFYIQVAINQASSDIQIREAFRYRFGIGGILRYLYLFPPKNHSDVRILRI